MLPRIEHFVRDLSPAQARALFKHSVASISIAISSYCNRQCSYCPNSVADRKSHRFNMDDALFFSILRQLGAIGYDGLIHIHRYNEPLADRDYALARMRDIRAFLPNAPIRVFTNGDYMDRRYVDSMDRLGVAVVEATVHAGPGGRTDIASLIVEQDRRMAELGLEFTVTPEDGLAQKYRVATARCPGGMVLVINAHDFLRVDKTGNTWASDRGGSVAIEREHRRWMPCLSPFVEMEIEWDGTLLPCCQINNDAFSHRDYVMGTLRPDSDLFLAWAAPTYVKWRIAMSSTDPKPAPCTTCSYGTPIGEHGEAIVKRLAEMRALLAKHADAAPS
jgi:MoaA/NifB/PqqE/SkfB family radical SAM enzyme